jgi:beta-galactosidase GanA
LARGLLGRRYKVNEAAGFTVTRMAEFAWSTMEPSEGDFDFDWLERSIEQIAAAGILWCGVTILPRLD